MSWINETVLDTYNTSSLVYLSRYECPDARSQLIELLLIISESYGTRCYHILLSARHAPHELSVSCNLWDCIHSATSLMSDAIRSIQYMGTGRERTVFRHLYSSTVLSVASVGYDLKSNDLKSRFEIKFLNCDFDFNSFSNKWFRFEINFCMILMILIAKENQNHFMTQLSF